MPVWLDLVIVWIGLSLPISTVVGKAIRRSQPREEAALPRVRHLVGPRA